jgi:hypothetical protein
MRQFKIMKYFTFLSMILALCMMQACDPLEDEIDGLEIPTTVSADLEITLTEDDYDLVDQSFPNFGSEEDARNLIPIILTENFPALGGGSSALVTYDLFRGSAPGLSTYTGADSYELSADDYSSADPDAGEAGFFNNSVTAEDNIPGILAANITSPADGDLVGVTYEFAEIEYDEISGVEIYAENFEGIADLNAFETFSLEGDQMWHLYMSSSPYYAARMSGFDGGSVANEDWLVLPEIDLSGLSQPVLRLEQVVNFCGSCEIGVDVAVRISTDYTGDPTTTTWTDLELDQWPAGDSYDIYNSEVSLEDYVGQAVRIGFYYKSTTDYAPQWRLITILVDQGEAVPTIRKNRFYEFSGGEWEAVSENEVYYLSSADYDAMGAPGNFDNFSSSVPAADYLPALLRLKYPYAQEEDEIFVIYKYFSSSAGGVQTRGDFYTFTGGVWEVYESIGAQTLSFGHNGNTWVPDNTIKYTLTGADYVAMAEASADWNPAGSQSMGTFGNVDVSLWSEEQIIQVIGARLIELFPTVVDQKYLVSYDTWEPGAGVRTIHLIYNGSEYVKVE